MLFGNNGVAFQVARGGPSAESAALSAARSDRGRRNSSAGSARAAPSQSEDFEQTSTRKVSLGRGHEATSESGTIRHGGERCQPRTSAGAVDLASLSSGISQAVLGSGFSLRISIGGEPPNTPAR